MNAKSYSLNYDGYWREPSISGIPANSGIYTVYSCHHNIAEGTVSIRKLIYIGESMNAKDRILKHERWSDWRRYLQPGEELCFNFSPIIHDRERVEAALINEHKPPANHQHVNDFPYPQTTVSTAGRNALLKAYFTVYTTRSSLYGAIR